MTKGEEIKLIKGIELENKKMQKTEQTLRSMRICVDRKNETFRVRGKREGRKKRIWNLQNKDICLVHTLSGFLRVEAKKYFV